MLSWAWAFSTCCSRSTLSRMYQHRLSHLRSPPPPPSYLGSRSQRLYLLPRLLSNPSNFRVDIFSSTIDAEHPLHLIGLTRGHGTKSFL